MTKSTLAGWRLNHLNGSHHGTSRTEQISGKRAAMMSAETRAESKRLATKAGNFHAQWCANGA
jgi:hypothetical protein